MKDYNLKWVWQMTKGGGMRVRLALYMLMIICSAVTSVAIAFVLMLFIDVATGDSGLSVGQVVILAAGVLVMSGILAVIAAYNKTSYVAKLENRIRKNTMMAIFATNTLELQKIHTGEINTRISTDVRSIAEFIPTILHDIVGAIILSLFAIISIFILSWQVAVTLLVSVPILIGILSLFNIPIAKIDKKNKSNDEKARLYIQESLNVTTLVKSYSAQSMFTEKLSTLLRNRYKSDVHFGTFEGFMFFVNELLVSLILLVTLGAGTHFVLTGATTVGALVAMVQLLNYILNPLSRISKAFAATSQTKVSAQRLGEILEMSKDETLQPVEDSIGYSTLEGTDISFQYNEGAPILSNLNFTARINEITGIVGESGAGKSTLLRILMGLYAPNGGIVTLSSEGGQRSQQILPHVAYVSSDNYLFAGTIKENIAMSTQIDSKKLQKAAELANIMDFINQQPDKFDTVIEERGGSLSSGQAQRIAIARALYKNSPVLILDEPSANLDADSRAAVKASLRDIAKEKICVVVSHDTEFLEVCDSVVSVGE